MHELPDIELGAVSGGGQETALHQFFNRFYGGALIGGSTHESFCGVCPHTTGHRAGAIGASRLLLARVR